MRQTLDYQQKLQKVNINAIKVEKNVIGVEEIIAVYSSIPEFSQVGTKTIELPIPNIPTTNPASNPEIIQFHIFLELILSVYLRNTKPCFCFQAFFVAICIATDFELR